MAIGYDMMADATRRAAMDRARDTGEPTASRGVTLVQEIDRHKQRGFLIYVPVYRDGHVPSSVAARREALIGFVYCPFRVDDLLAGVFGSQHEPRVTFEVFDSRPQPREETLLRTGGSRGRNDAWFSTTRRVPIAGRTWALRVRSTPSFERTAPLEKQWLLYVQESGPQPCIMPIRGPCG